MKKHKNWISIILSLIITQGCVEQFDYSSTSSSKQNLVVRALLTNELKKHTIELSRTVPIDSIKIEPEKKAAITITSDIGETYSFYGNEKGVYTSNVEFSAKPDRTYILNIKTQDGNSYISSAEKLPSNSQIENINFTIENNTLGGFEEIVFRVNSKLSEDEGKLYRYEYDETYKVKPIFWSSKKLIVTSNTLPYKFDLVDKNPNIEGTGICYGNNYSEKIILTETKTLSQDKVINFPIRKIPIDSYIIGIRYSILVKQYVLNQNTYNFYKLLDKFSDPNNIFSQIQVGNIQSNIVYEPDPEKNKVFGFFEVSSLSTKRTFFNRSELTDTPFINYSSNECINEINPEITDSFGNSPLLDKIKKGWIYQRFTEPPVPNKPYLLVEKKCGDCTHLGPISQPKFWID
jgi:hypothetical protein